MTGGNVLMEAAKLVILLIRSYDELRLSDLQLDSLLQVLVSLLDQLFGPEDSVPHHVFGATTAD